MSVIACFPSKTGLPTAQCGTRQLHSRFDPQREADRFVEQSLDESVGTIVVIGPGLGYCFTSIRRRHPASRLIGISLEPGLLEHAVAHPDALWQHGTRVSLPEFLDQQLSDLESATLALLEWSPVAAAFATRAAEARDAVLRHLKRAQASLTTQGATGRRWFRNAIHNYLRIEPVYLTASDKRIAARVVVGAGPSADVSLPLLKGVRDRVELWVTGSALATVLHHGLEPDLVIVTDAAVYAHEHLRPLVTGMCRPVPIAAPLGATRGAASCPCILPIAEGEPGETDLLRGITPSPAVIPPHGTVSATAAALARSLGDAPLVFAGVDFGWHEGRSHARPHLAEVYRRTAADRLSPETTTLYRTAVNHSRIEDAWSTDRSLETYASWFERESVRRFGPVYVLTPSPAMRALPELSPGELNRLGPRFPAISWRAAPWPEPAARATRARAYLRDAARRAAGTNMPLRPAHIEETAPGFAHLAVRFALPALLRWYRDGRAEQWDEVRTAVLHELAAAEELVP